MIQKTYDSKCLSIQDAAAVLEKDSSLVARLIRQGRIDHYESSNGKHYTTEADIRRYLTSRLPSGYVATLSEDYLTVT